MFCKKVFLGVLKNKETHELNTNKNSQKTHTEEYLSSKDAGL